jgi:GT2 family glycosyltransferase
MHVAIYTLTWNRLEYTKHCLEVLRAKAGYPYDHIIIDNGSSDGTVEWLGRQDFHAVVSNPVNAGISRASNQALDLAREHDLIIKFDNDCEIVTGGILARIVELFERAGAEAAGCVLSPRVEGVNHQPERGWHTTLAGQRIGWTSVVGGLFHIAPARLYQQYRYPEELPKGRGQDVHFCDWVRDRGGQVGYLEDLLVNHYESTNRQWRRYPDYFRQKELPG